MSLISTQHSECHSESSPTNRSSALCQKLNLKRCNSKHHYEESEEIVITTNVKDDSVTGRNTVIADVKNVSDLKASKSTSLITNQRNRILKIRREERVSLDGKVSDVRHIYEQKMASEIDHSQNTEKKKCKISSDITTKISKTKYKWSNSLLDYSSINDLFSETLNMKELYTTCPMKRDVKIPGKFLYLSKMGKYLSHSAASRKNCKLEHAGHLSHRKIKEEKSNKITKSDGILKVQVHNKKRKKKYSNSANNITFKHNSNSLSHKLSRTTSLKKSHTLRADNIHQQNLHRYYRLRSANWKSCSETALKLLKRKYKSLKMLFNKEPVVFLERLASTKIGTKSENVTCVSEHEGNIQIKQKCPSERSKFENNNVTIQVPFVKEIKTQKESLVDPRVMSLSKALVSGNNGKVGIEKIFKNRSTCSGKPIGRKKTDISNSQTLSLKNTNKPDIVKWRGKLKEASNRMSEKRSSRLVVEKTPDIIPFMKDNATNCRNSILHFRIPLKSSYKHKDEGNNNMAVIKEKDKSEKGDRMSEAKFEGIEPLEPFSNVNEMSQAKNEDVRALDEINEQLTLEEYETDSYVSYTINGYSIELHRDSPTQLAMDKDKNDGVNECFDEEEMNKILYGDSREKGEFECNIGEVKIEHDDDSSEMEETECNVGQIIKVEYSNEIGENEYNTGKIIGAEHGKDNGEYEYNTGKVIKVEHCKGNGEQQYDTEKVVTVDHNKGKREKQYNTDTDIKVEHEEHIDFKRLCVASVTDITVTSDIIPNLSVSDEAFIREYDEIEDSPPALEQVFKSFENYDDDEGCEDAKAVNEIAEYLPVEHDNAVQADGIMGSDANHMTVFVANGEGYTVYTDNESTNCDEDTYAAEKDTEDGSTDGKNDSRKLESNTYQFSENEETFCANQNTPEETTLQADMNDDYFICLITDMRSLSQTQTMNEEIGEICLNKDANEKSADISDEVSCIRSDFLETVKCNDETIRENPSKRESEDLLDVNCFAESVEHLAQTVQHVTEINVSETEIHRNKTESEGDTTKVDNIFEIFWKAKLESKKDCAATDLSRGDCTETGMFENLKKHTDIGSKDIKTLDIVNCELSVNVSVGQTAIKSTNENIHINRDSSKNLSIINTCFESKITGGTTNIDLSFNGTSLNESNSTTPPMKDNSSGYKQVLEIENVYASHESMYSECLENITIDQLKNGQIKNEEKYGTDDMPTIYSDPNDSVESDKRENNIDEKLSDVVKDYWVSDQEHDVEFKVDSDSEKSNKNNSEEKSYTKICVKGNESFKDDNSGCDVSKRPKQPVECQEQEYAELTKTTEDDCKDVDDVVKAFEIDYTKNGNAKTIEDDPGANKTKYQCGAGNKQDIFKPESHIPKFEEKENALVGGHKEEIHVFGDTGCQLVGGYAKDDHVDSDLEERSEVGYTGSVLSEEREFKEHYGNCDDLSSLSDDNSELSTKIELNEERIVHDFPNHNWLFNKYNLYEVDVNTERVKRRRTNERKHKRKQKMKDTDVSKRSTETKHRKSMNSMANILPTLRKSSTNKTDTSSKTSRSLQILNRNNKDEIGFEHNSVTVKNRNSCVNDRDSIENEMLSVGKNDYSRVGQALNLEPSSMPKFDFFMSGKNEHEVNIDTEDKYQKEVIKSVSYMDICEVPGDLSIATTGKKQGDGVNTKLHKGDTAENCPTESSSASTLGKGNNPGSAESSPTECSSTLLNNIIESLLSAVFEVNERSTETLSAEAMQESGSREAEIMKETTAALSLKESEKLCAGLLGHNIDDDDDDGDDYDVKLTIDEDTVYVEDDVCHAADETMPNMQEPSTNDLKPGSIIDESAVLNRPILSPVVESPTNKPGSLRLHKTGPLPGQTLIESPVANSSEIGPLDLCTVKSETNSNNFRPRTKPLVQLVHPQVHKPQNEPVTVELGTVEIQTSVASPTQENSEVAVSSAVTSEIVSSSAYSVRSGTSSGKCSSLTRISSVSANQELPMSSSTSTTASITSAATSSSNYGSGIIIPIQPFGQTVSNTLVQGCYQNVSQLQPNIVQFQSQPIQPIFQQISPIQIQNQLIPVTIYQAGNQALFSNYTYINPGRGQMISSQSVNFQAQPLNSSANHSQLNSSANPSQLNSSANPSQLLSSNCGAIPIHSHVSTVPPPLLIVPKPSDMPKLRVHVDATPVVDNCSPVKTASPSTLTSIPKSQQQSVTQCSSSSVNDDSHETNTATSRIPNTTLESVSDAIDDEIKKQMEELDREIQRKELEQEQMKRKKSELLEKMKQAKSAQPAKNVENDKREMELRELHELDAIQNSTKATSVVAVGINRAHSEDGNVGKEAKKSCKDVVLSEIVEDTRDCVFGYDTPIDLSSAIKSSQIIRITDENLSVTVSNGVISIKERNIDPSLTSDSIHASRKSLGSRAGKVDNLFSDMDSKESILSDKYAANKGDGLNYIEDIGMVNPFTGEYEINVDIEEERVDYLDLSAKPDADSENKLADDLDENITYKEFESATLNDVTFKQVEIEDSAVGVWCSKVYVRKDKEFAAESQLKLTKSIKSSDNVIIQAPKPEIHISSTSSLTSSITNVSSVPPIFSIITCSVTQSSPLTSTKSSECKIAPVITHTRASNSLDALVDVDNNDATTKIVETGHERCFSGQNDEALNLKKTKVAVENFSMFSDQPVIAWNLEKIKIAMSEKGLLDLIDMDIMYCNSTSIVQYPLPLQADTNAKCRAKYSQSQIYLTESDEEANKQPKNAAQDHSKYRSRYSNAQKLQAYQKQKNQMPRSNVVTATDIPLIELTPLNMTRSSSQNLKLQNKSLTETNVSGAMNSCNSNHGLFVNNQNETLTSDSLMTPMVHQRKAREKIIDIKPAHYRSPPVKVQRSAKPSMAHSQKATSRETMKRMSILPSNFPVPVKKTSPYISSNVAVYLNPKEVDNPIPKQFHKRPAKPAHNKRPFGIAGHLIVQCAKKYRKRSASGEMVLSPQFYSLPNTPTSSSRTPLRATSVDSHDISNSDLPTDNQGHVYPVGNSASPLKMKEHHGAQVGLPVPIRAHCRPKSLISTGTCNKFYETSVLRPPALLQNVKCQSESSADVDVIDLTPDVVPPLLVSNAVTLKTTKSKESAIQQELNNAGAKKQRIENVENLPVERNTSQMRQDSSIIRPQQPANKCMMPPPPYTGRQRMPVLAQVPRRPSVAEQRLAYERRVELQFEEGRRLVPHGQSDMHCVQNHDPQTRPQRWSPQYVGPNQESERRYGARDYQSGPHTQDFIPGNHLCIPSQQNAGMVSSQQRIYSPRCTICTTGSATNGQPVRRLDQYTGNPRMQRPFDVSQHNIPQHSISQHNLSLQGYPMRGQSMAYASTQNDLLQQTHSSSQMMQIDDSNPQLLANGGVNPQMMQRGVGTQMMQRDDSSPQLLANGGANPHMMQRGVSTQMMQRDDSSPQMPANGGVSPYIMQRGIRSQMMQSNGVGLPVMQTREINPHLMYSHGSSSQLMQPDELNPQMSTRRYLSPTVMQTAEDHTQMMQTNFLSAAGYHRLQVQSDHPMQGNPNPVPVQPTLTPEQKLLKMQQIRAQHIWSQQLQNRNQPGGIEQGSRHTDSRNQLIGMEHGSRQTDPRNQQIGMEHGSRHTDQGNQQIGMEHGSRHADQATAAQSRMGYNSGEPAGLRRTKMQPATYPQQMASLEPQFDRNMHESLQQHRQFLQQNNVNTVHMDQNPVSMTTMQQQHNHGYRQPMIVSNRNSQVSQSMTVANKNISRMGISHIGHNIHDQNSRGHHSHHISNQVLLQQGQGQTNISVPVNMTVTGDGQIIQCSSNKQTLEKASQQCPAEQFQKQNCNQVSQLEKGHGHSSPLIPRTTNLTQQVQTTHVPSQNSVIEKQPIIVHNETENVLLSNSSNQNGNNISINKSTAVTMTTSNQPIPSSPQTQPAAAMTTDQSNPHMVRSATLPVEPTHSVQQPKTEIDPDSHSESGGILGQGQIEVKNKSLAELPDLQQIHGECVMCGKYSLYLCSSCKKIWYCSPECQLTHWKTHAAECYGGVS